MNILRAVVEYAVVRGVGATVSMVPSHEIEGISAALGRIVRLLDRRHLRVAGENLKRALPQLSPRQRIDLITRLYCHLVGVFFELQHLRRLSECASELALSCAHHIRNITNGRPAIFVTGHIGNWELTGAVIANIISPFLVVARRMDNPFLERYFTALRRRFGIDVVHKHGAVKKVLPLLRRGVCVGMVVDQHASADNLFVDFLGRRAAVVKTPALLAVKTGAPVVPVCTLREGTFRYTFLIGKVLRPDIKAPKEGEIVRITTAFTAQIERWVRMNPHQWLWTHRRWKSVRIGDR